MSLWRRAMVYLGLQDDDEFDDYAHHYDDDYDRYDYDEAPPRRAPAMASDEPAEQDLRVSRSPALRDPVGVETAPSVRPLPREKSSRETPAVRPIPASGGDSGRSAPHIVVPAGFNDAQEVGDRLKGHQPVALNLRDLGKDLQRRLIDFSSGLAYGTGASMSRLDDGVFLLAPSGVEVSQEEKDRLQAQDYRP